MQRFFSNTGCVESLVDETPGKGPRGSLLPSAAQAAMITRMRLGASSCPPSVVGTAWYLRPCCNRDGDDTDEVQHSNIASLRLPRVFIDRPLTATGGPLAPGTLPSVLMRRPSCQSQLALLPEARSWQACSIRQSVQYIYTASCPLTLSTRSSSASITE